MKFSRITFYILAHLRSCIFCLRQTVLFDSFDSFSQEDYSDINILSKLL